MLLTLYNTLILPHFNYCIISRRSVLRENHQLHLLQKKAIRIITNSNYIEHAEPLLKELELPKITCVFTLSIWKFYYKLIILNYQYNQLPVYLAIIKPVLPQVCTRYEIRNLVYHLPDIRHAFAQQSLKYCFIKRLNTEEGYADMVHNTSFKNY